MILFLGVKCAFDPHRLIHSLKVMEAEDKKKHICVRDKEVDSLYAMYFARFDLYKKGQYLQ